MAKYAVCREHGAGGYSLFRERCEEAIFRDCTDDCCEFEAS